MALDLRQAVRALLLDEHDHLLLVRWRFPSGIEAWGLPGGGLDPAERAVDGLRRELDEELSLSEVTIGPEIWRRTHIIPMVNGQDGQHDRIFLVRTTRFEPMPRIGWEAMRSEFVHELRWWTLDQIDDATNAGVRFAPRWLGRHARRVVESGPPTRLLDVGV